MNGYLELYKLFNEQGIKDTKCKAEYLDDIIAYFQLSESSTLAANQHNFSRQNNRGQKSTSFDCDKKFAIKEYEHFFNKYYQALKSSGSEPFTVRTASPLLVNFGIGGALETGIALHRIYGVPYLPGSALKGLTAHYAHQVLGVSGKNSSWQMGGEDHTALFGTTSEAGYVQFHDALILPASVNHCLHLDVMTPHHQNYNGMMIEPEKGYDAQKEYSAPRDDDSPLPIHFLHIKGCFNIILSGDDSVSDSQIMQQWLMIAQKLLLAALQQEGIGAKTSTGYGRMVQDKSAL
ncbi:type III-B CRISPR module RAMP protein Cmr6 [Paenibacillus campi]|uniref:type III-B CRISPR module RAMP protein Cmr6 n=1 Tax=Paenibacillus campi TaxID=3106031 RepID=UPI002AFF87EE|nr:type III-B CRISPR module RAMP protein Cmr6 [Paenibacillus sp. SGZ-1014]